jgi:hypothetical protein
MSFDPIDDEQRKELLSVMQHATGVNDEYKGREPYGKKTIGQLVMMLDARCTLAENEKEQAIKQANARDEKWMTGIEAACGCKINFQPGIGPQSVTTPPPPSLADFIAKLRAQHDGTLGQNFVYDQERKAAQDEITALRTLLCRYAQHVGVRTGSTNIGNTSPDPTHRWTDADANAMHAAIDDVTQTNCDRCNGSGVWLGLGSTRERCSKCRGTGRLAVRVPGAEG